MPTINRRIFFHLGLSRVHHPAGDLFQVHVRFLSLPVVDQNTAAQDCALNTVRVQIGQTLNNHVGSLGDVDDSAVADMGCNMIGILIAVGVYLNAARDFRLCNPFPGSFEVVVNFLIMPIFFLSGALFPLEGIPGWLKVLTHGNPLTYGIDGMRYALGGTYRFSPLLSLVVLLQFWVVTTLAGAILFKRMPA